MGFDRFCVKCGKTTDALIKGMCQECFLKRHELFEIKDFDIEVCVKCGKMKVKGRWGAYNFDAIGTEVASKVKFLIDVDQPKVVVNVEPISQFDFDSKIDIAGFIDGVLVEQSINYPFSLDKVSCDPCMKVVSNYREAIIQLRAGAMSEADEMFQIAKTFLDEERAKDSLAAVIKVGKLPHGYDLWIGSNKGAYKVVRKLEKLYKVKALESKKLIGEDRSRRQKFRFTYCIKKK
jgi:nonsense-mediated mRNA decay protein 3